MHKKTNLILFIKASRPPKSYESILSHYLSSVYPIPKMELRKVLLLTIRTAGDTSLKNVWVKRLRPMHLDKNSKDMFSKSQAAMTVTVLP